MTPEEYKKCWQDIINAGGPEAYIERELRSSGVYRYQRKTAKECYFRNKLMSTSNNMKDKWDVIRVIINRGS